jgi:fatty acid desaturase
MQYVSDEEIKAQAWKFYFIAVVWPLYLLLLPWVFKVSTPVALLLMIFPGVYLFTWTGFLMHETWHKYVPSVPNGFFYNLLSWLLLTDPQIYKIVHGFHHSLVNSWSDFEFHPLGKISNTPLRRLYNFLEIVFGIAFITAVSTLALPVHPQFGPKYRYSKLAGALAIVTVCLGGIAAINHYLLNVPIHTIAIALAINIWLDSFVLHHSQLVEHGNLIVDGDWNERNSKVRNLKADGPLEKLFLFFTHGDSREHVLHHTQVAVYSRPFPGKVPMPPTPVYINLKDYAGILWKMITEAR